MIDYKIIQGDALQNLKTLPDQSVQCVITSPPYYGLRDYGVDGQMGLESTLPEYIQNMVALFRQVRCVLKDNGTLWLNMADRYAAEAKNRSVKQAISRSTLSGSINTHCTILKQQAKKDLPKKNLLGVPWRLALALQDDGWMLRQDIIWHKPNPMPESVRDRCTKAHEYLFLFTKGPHYYFDHEAFKEPVTGVNPKAANTEPHNTPHSHKGSKFHTGKTGQHQAGRSSARPRQNTSGLVEFRNRRSVWTIATEKSPSPDHYATYPMALVTPCILAGTRPNDIVLDPFSGTATTGAAALKLGRRYTGIELNPKDVEFSIDRLRAIHAQPDFVNQLQQKEIA